MKIWFKQWSARSCIAHLWDEMSAVESTKSTRITPARMDLTWKLKAMITVTQKTKVT